MLDLHSLGQEVLIQRKARAMTQSALAVSAGVSRATIAALEAGKLRELGFGKVERIVAAVGLELRVGPANRGRPTLADLQKESEA